MTGRERFVQWLRGCRHALVAGPSAGEALHTLGLDDAGLARWVAAERVVATLPHASPNVFFPRAGVAWYVRHLQDRDAELFHSRIAVSHVNFSDLSWRPYAWWHVDGAGRLQRSTFFTRNKKRKHVVVASRGPITVIPGSAEGVDKEAARLALAGTDLAMSYLLIMATVEQAAGLALPGRTVCLPLSLLVEYARKVGDAGGVRADARWLAALVAGATGRRILDDGRLAQVADSREADVFDNPSNIALLAALGEQGVIGGAKMAGYWAEVVERVTAAGTRSGAAVEMPRMMTWPASIDYESYVAPSPALREQLDAAAISYSQGMALTEHGAFADRMDPFRDE